MPVPIPIKYIEEENYLDQVAIMDDGIYMCPTGYVPEVPNF